MEHQNCFHLVNGQSRGGGRAFGRNQRLRRALLPAPPDAVPRRAALLPTTAEAIALLDAQFPWLRAAERRVPFAAGVRRASTSATTKWPDDRQA